MNTLYNRTEVAQKASDVPPVFDWNEKWMVMDEYGNKYIMKKCPSDVFLTRKGNNMELHIVYSTEVKSKLPGQNSVTRKTNGNPF